MVIMKTDNSCGCVYGDINNGGGRDCYGGCDGVMAVMVMIMVMTVVAVVVVASVMIVMVLVVTMAAMVMMGAWW